MKGFISPPPYRLAAVALAELSVLFCMALMTKMQPSNMYI